MQLAQHHKAVDQVSSQKRACEKHWPKAQGSGGLGSEASGSALTLYVWSLKAAR